MRPLRIVEVELGVDPARGPCWPRSSIPGADVAPVLRRPSCSRRRTVGEDRRLRDERGRMSLPKSWLAVAAASASSGLGQHVGVEDVDAHRRQRQARLAGHRLGLGRLLLEADHPAVVVDLRRRRSGAPRATGTSMVAMVTVGPVLVRCGASSGSPSCRRGRPRGPARAGPFALDGVEVLVDRVRRAQVPVFADALLRRQNLDELAQFLRDDVPAHADVAVQRERLVLGGDEDASQAGVDAVGEGEVDDAVGPPKYTAGLARSLVSGDSRSPAPPASTMTSASLSMGHPVQCAWRPPWWRIDAPKAPARARQAERGGKPGMGCRPTPASALRIIYPHGHSVSGRVCPMIRKLGHAGACRGICTHATDSEDVARDGARARSRPRSGCGPEEGREGATARRPEAAGHQRARECDQRGHEGRGGHVGVHGGPGGRRR